MRLSNRPLPVEVDGLEEYEVQSILDSRMVRGRIQYLVEWKGYGPEERTWEPVSNLNCPVLVDLFHEQHPGRPGQPPGLLSLRGGSVAITWSRGLKPYHAHKTGSVPKIAMGFFP